MKKTLIFLALVAGTVMLLLSQRDNKKQTPATLAVRVGEVSPKMVTGEVPAANIVSTQVTVNETNDVTVVGTGVNIEFEK